MAERPKTRLNPKWLLKITLFIIGTAAFGSWGLYDATIHYPRRGARAAEFNEWKYLELSLDPRNAIEVGGQIAIPDPARARTDLKSRERSLLSQVEAARLEWLDSLAVINRLHPRATDFGATVDGQPRPTAPERFLELDQAWKRTDGKPVDRPTALQWYDLPSQWLIAFVCYGLALYLAWLIARTKMRTYAWDASDKRLHLPGGESIVPADIAEFDKRKWHKYFVALRIGPSHPKLAGKAVSLDLLRYQPLEEWVLAMEAAKGPDPSAPTVVATPPEAQPEA